MIDLFQPFLQVSTSVLICLACPLTSFPQEIVPAANMADTIRQYQADYESLTFKYRFPMSAVRFERLKKFFSEKLVELEQINFQRLPHDGQVDYLLLKNRLVYQLRNLEIDRDRDRELESLIPFGKTIVDLGEAREMLERIDPRETAELLEQLRLSIESARKKLTDALEKQSSNFPGQASTVYRAAVRVDELRSAFNLWHKFYNGYDPLYSWWAKKPYEAVDIQLAAYADFLRERIVGVGAADRETIIGQPIGEQALLTELRYEMIPYTPAELIQIAERQFAWCDKEMDKAAREMGFDDWRKAQEQVKKQHVAPGEQPQMIKDLAWEAIRFVEAHDLVTVPPLAKETWRMAMMSPDRQRVNPYFLGGPTIVVSFPTDEMTQQEKMISMRGNNIHFARATVQHELIPGHHLQGYMRDRHRTYRQIFETPFWIEGWALYWEMLLWDLDFPQSPEDRVGMLFWRKHRCARIIFSLSYHLERMSPPECVHFLVERVGHERKNAEAEVRRSVMAGYGPLYQAAYMLGGLQIRALHAELVQGGKLTNRQFHDAILKENSIPIEMLRAILTEQPLQRDFQSTWRFDN